MADPYVGEIRLFAGSFAPVGWHLCDGLVLAISENEFLFNLIGTTYGGDGQQTFALPDLRGRVPLHMGASFNIGQTGGVEEVTLNSNQLPSHSHPWMATSGAGTQNNPGGNALAASPSVKVFIEDDPDSNLNAGMLTSVGGNQPHSNMQPFLALSFIISLFGRYPTQN